MVCPPTPAPIPRLTRNPPSIRRAIPADALSRQSRGNRAGPGGVVTPQCHGKHNDRKASEDNGPWPGAEPLEPLGIEVDGAKGGGGVDDPAPAYIRAPEPDEDEQPRPSDDEDVIRDVPRRSAPSLRAFRLGIGAAAQPALARIVAPQRADPKPEIDEQQRHARKDQRQSLVDRPHLQRDEIGRRREHREDENRDRRLADHQHVGRVRVAGTATERTGDRERHQGHQKAAADQRREHEQQSGRETGADKGPFEEADHPARQQQRADDYGCHAEQAPFCRTAKRHRKSDKHKSDAERRPSRKGRVEREDAGRYGSRAKNHQGADRESARVVRSEALQPLRFVTGEFAFLHQPGDVENDLDVRSPFIDVSAQAHYAGLMTTSPPRTKVVIWMVNSCPSRSRPGFSTSTNRRRAGCRSSSRRPIAGPNIRRISSRRRGSIRWPCGNPKTALSTSCSPPPRSSAPRCCRPAFRGLTSTSTGKLTSSTRRCSASPCRAMSMPARRGCASGSARSPASLPAARTSTPGSCALPMPNGASSVFTTLTIKSCAGWSKRRRACSAVISSSIAIRCRRAPAAVRTVPISSSAIATGRPALPESSRQPAGFSPSVVSSSRSMRPMPGASQQHVTDGRARIATRCRSRSTGRFTWMNAVIAESRSSRSWSKTSPI